MRLTTRRCCHSLHTYVNRLAQHSAVYHPLCTCKRPLLVTPLLLVTPGDNFAESLKVVVRFSLPSVIYADSNDARRGKCYIVAVHMLKPDNFFQTPAKSVGRSRKSCLDQHAFVRCLEVRVINVGYTRSARELFCYRSARQLFSWRVLRDLALVSPQPR